MHKGTVIKISVQNLGMINSEAKLVPQILMEEEVDSSLTLKNNFNRIMF
jgi:hypothetical protein